MAFGLLTVCLLDTALRASYRPGQDALSAMWRGGVNFCRPGCQYVCRELVQKFTLLPLSTWDELSHVEAVLYALAWFLVLFPVPLARVVTNDHTLAQVVVGASIGFTEACCWSYMVHHLQHRFNHMLGHTWKLRSTDWIVLTHNFALPRFVAEQRVKAVPVQSSDPERELLWYEETTARRASALAQMSQLHQLQSANEMQAEQQYLQQRQVALHRLRETVHGTRQVYQTEAGEQEAGRARGGSRIEMCQASSQGSVAPASPPPAG